MSVLPVSLDSLTFCLMREYCAIIEGTEVLQRSAFWCLMVSPPALCEAGTEDDLAIEAIMHSDL